MQSSTTEGLLVSAWKEKAYYDDESLKEVIDSLELLGISSTLTPNMPIPKASTPCGKGARAA